MKKIAFLIAVVLLLALTACKVNPTEEVAEKAVVEEVPLQQWAYNFVTAECAYDGSSSQVVCVVIPGEDSTYLTNLLNQWAQQGWELDDILHTGSQQTFIFRKALQ